MIMLIYSPDAPDAAVQQMTRARRQGFVVWVVPGVLIRTAEVAVVKALMSLAEWASCFRWV